MSLPPITLCFCTLDTFSYNKYPQLIVSSFASYFVCLFTCCLTVFWLLLFVMLNCRGKRSKWQFRLTTREFNRQYIYQYRQNREINVNGFIFFLLLRTVLFYFFNYWQTLSLSITIIVASTPRILNSHFSNRPIFHLFFLHFVHSWNEFSILFSTEMSL